MVKLVVGNWKMNGCLNDISFMQTIAETADTLNNQLKTVICVPSVFIHHFSNHIKTHHAIFEIGGQNCHHLKTGAYTGEVSADMLKDVGAHYVIVGHSERRTDCYESDIIVHDKANTAFDADLIPIICVGETHEQYIQGISKKIIVEQIKHSVPHTVKKFAIGYEPIWAIGTGLIPQFDEIAAIHLTIYETLKGLLGTETTNKVDILYGGSVKPSNACDIANIDYVNGALVGGASLNASDFTQIMTAFAH
jgi:triosephosphate isomerase (TIM)